MSCPQPLVAQGAGMGAEPRVWGQGSPLRHLQQNPEEKSALTISGMKSTSGKVARTARPLGKALVEVEEDIGSLWHGDFGPLCSSELNAASSPLPLSLPPCLPFLLCFLSSLLSADRRRQLRVAQVWPSPVTCSHMGGVRGLRGSPGAVAAQPGCPLSVPGRSQWH